MGLFKKKPDPITDRSSELNAKIAALESRIKKLNQELHSGAASGNYQREPPSPARQPSSTPPSGEPIFEKVDQNQLKTPASTPDTPRHFNELGVRKYDLFSLIDRIRRQFQGPPAANPKLVNYLAAGSIQGLRPLRYEKRVARNRFMALLAILGLICLLILSYALEHRH
jgi:hypothetical protein